MQQAADEVGAIQLHAAHAVGALRAAGGQLADALQAAQQPGPGAIQTQAPAQLRQQRGVEEGDVPGAEQLTQRLQQCPGAAQAQAFAQPVADMVEARSGEAGVGRQQRLDAWFGHRFPALDRAPVMGDQVHPATCAGGVDDRFEVARQLWQAVVLHASRHLRCAAATHVVGDDAVVVGQLADQRQPDLVIVRIAMHQQQGRGIGPVPDVTAQAQAVAVNVQLLRRQVVALQGRVHRPGPTSRVSGNMAGSGQ